MWHSRKSAPPVGSRVMVGKFELLRPLRLLDVAALESVFVKGSIFDSGYIRRLEQAKFLERLSHRITMPVMPTDEASDYLITQAIADYLAAEVNLDGIVYPSAQAGGAAHSCGSKLYCAFEVLPPEVLDRGMYLTHGRKTRRSLNPWRVSHDDLPIPHQGLARPT